MRWNNFSGYSGDVQPVSKHRFWYTFLHIGTNPGNLTVSQDVRKLLTVIAPNCCSARNSWSTQKTQIVIFYIFVCVRMKKAKCWTAAFIQGRNLKIEPATSPLCDTASWQCERFKCFCVKKRTAMNFNHSSCNPLRPAELQRLSGEHVDSLLG